MNPSLRLLALSCLVILLGTLPVGLFTPRWMPAWEDILLLSHGAPGQWPLLLSWGAGSRWLRDAPGSRQRFDDGCGAAVLHFLLETRGLRIPQTLLWSLTRLPTGGTTLPRMARTAQRFGVPCAVRRLSMARLQQPPAEALPHAAIVLHLRRAHFVLLLRLTPARAILLDPAMGFIDVSRRSLGHQASGLALVCDPGPVPVRWQGQVLRLAHGRGPSS